MTKHKSPPIKYAALEKICNDFVASGRDPKDIGVREVQRMLGTGGLTTVSRYIGMWLLSLEAAKADELPAAEPSPNVEALTCADADGAGVRRAWAVFDLMTAALQKQADDQETRAISLHAENCRLWKKLGDAEAAVEACETKLKEADSRWEHGIERGRQIRDRLVKSDAENDVLAGVLIQLIEQLTPPRGFNSNPVFLAAKKLADRLNLDRSDDE